MLVDDTLVFADSETGKLEQEAATKFPHKMTDVISKTPLEFNGVTVQLLDGTLVSHQRQKIQAFKLISDASEALSMKAKGLFVSTCTRPDMLSRVQGIETSLGNDGGEAAVKATNDMVKYAKRTTGRVLKFVSLDLSGDLRVVCFSDAAFNVNNKG